MSAHLISDTTLRDREAFEVRSRAAQAVHKFGGRYPAEHARALEVHDQALSRNLILVDRTDDSTKIDTHSETRRNRD